VTVRRVREYAREEAIRMGVKPSDIFSPCREWQVVSARWAVMRRLRADGFSLPQIGAWMGRHHTTVLHAVGSPDALTQ